MNEERIAKLMKELKQMDVDVTVVKDTEINNESSKDKTKGIVGNRKDVNEYETDDAVILEKAETGKGFELFMNPSKLSEDTKLKRFKR